MSEEYQKLRRQWSLCDHQRYAGLTTPAYIRRYDDIPYGPDPDWNVLDIYRNRYEAGPLPTILLVHGGGWVHGCKESYQFYGLELAKRGFAVVNFSYRLAPENRFPAQLEDAVRAVMWLMKHAEEYRLDTDRLFAAGDSAGGNILGMLCAYLTDETYRKKFPFDVPRELSGRSRPAFRAIAMNCGVYRLTELEKKPGIPDIGALVKDYLPEKAGNDILRLGDITELVNETFPPAYIMSCQGDYMKPHASMLLHAYRKAGAEAELHIFGTEEKPLYHVFHTVVQEPEGRRCNDEECAFFRKHM